LQSIVTEFIYGGSFDPVHYGHLNVIANLSALRPDWPIRIIPCAKAAIKKHKLVNFEARVSMLQLAIAEEIEGNSIIVGKQFEPTIVIDELEKQRNEKSYTLDTLRSLSESFSQRRFVLVVGVDTLVSMPLWYQWQELVDYCHLLVVNRPANGNSEDITASAQCKLMLKLGFSKAENLAQLEKESNGHYYRFNIEEKDISSTQIRTKLLQQQPCELLLPSSVREFIKNNLLYQSE
jgi:nicotinate-nucleotide adenylyltransferase